MGLRKACEKMRAVGVAPEAIAVFSHYYRLLEKGQQGTIREAEIAPVRNLPKLDLVSADRVAQRDALATTAVIKLNGGLGTSMGVSGPKAALPVKNGLTFLDIIVRQVFSVRREFDVPLPLILMNSFRTREESLAIIHKYDELPVGGLDLDFLQNIEPKLRVDDLEPVCWSSDPELEWCPPGHGDLFVAMVASGMLASLRDRGFRYVFVSNADNLGATPDGRIAAWMARHDVSFGMEVCRRTQSDRKGGHLARRISDGRLILRDTAQVADTDHQAFQDIARHCTFNTNNVWIDLDQLAALLERRDGIVGLPIMVNHKTVDPTDPRSTRVVQIETGMGSAIEVFEGAQAMIVDRSRFVPVKTTSDLLVLRSDLYELDDDAALHKTRHEPLPFIDLDPAHFAMLSDFEERFAAGVPSLVDADRLELRGDVTFGRGVRLIGEVEIVAPPGQRRFVPDQTTVRG
jgi:UTP--glucose-1-phosphate uridylyltransferase